MCGGGGGVRDTQHKKRRTVSLKYTSNRIKFGPDNLYTCTLVLIVFHTQLLYTLT